MNKKLIIHRNGDQITIASDGTIYDTYNYSKAVLDENSPIVLDIIRLLGGSHSLDGQISPANNPHKQP